MTQKRNRKRPKRRAIHCPTHHICMESVSQKHPLYASEPEHLQQRGLGRRRALAAVAGYSGAVPLDGEWLEAFWCDHCQASRWYHIRKVEATYTAALAPDTLWMQASGVILPTGNPSAGEFTRRQARQTQFNGIKDFRNIR